MGFRANTTERNRDIRDILKVASLSLATKQGHLPDFLKEADASEEIEEDCDIREVLGMVANGCGQRNASIDAAADFISPILLAA